MNVRRLIEVAAAASLTLSLGCTPPTAPDKPTWDGDVQPILRGSCSHCHGELAPKVAPAYRFDVCDPTSLKDGTGVEGAVAGAAAMSPLINTTIVDQGLPTQMPPPPAGRLSDYEITVLKNWGKLVADAGAQTACKKQNSNHDPKAKLIGTRWDGGDLYATVEISDSDGDQVFTKVKAGSASYDLLSSGRHEIKLSGASMGDAITVKMSDGYNSPSEITISK
jgi:hypothetical protein